MDKQYENKLHKDDRLNKTINKIREDAEMVANSLKSVNENDKYNLNDGLHSEESRKDDVFSRRINKENKIDFDELKKINSNEINSNIKQQSKEDKLETFADLINQVLGFKYC